MKKSLNGKKVETKRDVGSSVSAERLEAAPEAREARQEYYQVIIVIISFDDVLDFCCYFIIITRWS